MPGLLSTSYPGSFLRKDPGIGWSRVPLGGGRKGVKLQFLQALLKLLRSPGAGYYRELR